MLYVSDEVKNAFLSSGQKYLQLEFTDGSIIDNNSIQQESMELVQSLCDETTLTWGKTNSAEFSVNVLATGIRYKGKTFTAKIIADDNVITLGVFTVESDKISDDGAFRNLVCYDRIHYIADMDVTDWYNGVGFPIAVKNFRDSFMAYVGLEQEDITLCNDEILIEQSSVTGLSGLKVIESICEINACFGTIGRDGKFKYVELADINNATYPRPDLYPSETLFPRANVSETFTRSDYYLSTFDFEEFVVQQITEVSIKMSDSDLGTSVGEVGNTYTITDNMLCYGLTADTLETIATNFFEKVKLIKYQPFSVQCKGRPWMEVGDFVEVVGDKTTLKSAILHRTLSGITALNDTYNAEGTEYYPNNLNSVQNQINALKGSTASIEKTVDGLTIEVRDKVGEDEVVSAINVSKDTIELNGNRVIINSDKFKLTEDGEIESTGGTIAGWNIGDKLYVTTQAYLPPTRNVLNQLNRYMLDGTTPSDINLYDFNGDGKLTISDLVRCYNCIKGTMNMADMPMAKLTDVTIEIDPTSSLNTIKISGTNVWGELLEGIFGISKVANKLVETDQLLVNLIEADCSGQSRGFDFYFGSQDDKSSFVMENSWSDGHVVAGGNARLYNSDFEISSGSFYCTGTKSRLAETENYNKRLLYCYEMTTPMFGDIGEGRIDDTGKCYVLVDDIFGETIESDVDYHVFLQKYGAGDCWVSERNSSYFVVEGTPNLDFAWELKCTQKGYDMTRLEIKEEEQEVIEDE